MKWAALVLVVSLAKNDVIEKVFERQAEIARRLAAVDYRADFRFLEFDSLTRRNRNLGCVRRVMMTGYDDQRHVFLSASIDGRQVRGETLLQVCQELQRKGLIARRSRMPFLLATRGEYDYEILGLAQVNGESCWMIKFSPKRADARHLHGLGYVRAESYDVMRLEFAPAQLPFVVRNTQMILDYQPVQGFWLPGRFSMKMDLRLKVFKELLHRRLEIEDVYSDYRLKLNNEP